MKREKLNKLIFIVMESPLYMMLTSEQKQAIVSGISECYPFIRKSDR